MSEPKHPGHPGNVGRVTGPQTSPTVVEVLRFEDLPLGSRGSRRAIVRWSNGSEGDALTWYADEILSPVDGVGRHSSGLNAGNAAS
jgi:hypothetical protein